MGERTGIAWTDHTWNPWRGCTKVSAGCKHCYMFRDQERYGRDPTVVVRSKTTFDAPMGWLRGAGSGLVFTCSWSDWFHPAADRWREEAWTVIRHTPHLTYQILTKRPERMLEHLPWGSYGEPWPNVWLGVSVEQQRYDRRVALLTTIPAVVRFVSAEPLLGRVRLSLNGISWVIAGGESGKDARPCDLDWLRQIRDDCAARGVAFFLKQLGGARNPRAKALAVLDGRTHTEMPSVPSPAVPPAEEDKT